MRTSFSTIKAKLEVIEVGLDLNFKSSRLAIFQFAKPPETQVHDIRHFIIKRKKKYSNIHYWLKSVILKSFYRYLTFTVNNVYRRKKSKSFLVSILERLGHTNVESFQWIRKNVRSIEIARPTNLRVTEGRKT